MLLYFKLLSMKSTRLALTIAGYLLFVFHSHAQLPTLSDVDGNKDASVTGPLPVWDVAVVKPHAPDDRTMSWQMTDNSVSLKNLTLEQLICSAWDVKPYELSGLSGWMKSSRFDLTAKVSPDDLAAYKKLSTPQRLRMLQDLLSERFRLRLHEKNGISMIYNLIVDKGGPKFETTTALAAPSEEEAKANPGKYKKGLMTFGPGMYQGTGVNIHSLVSQVANAVEKPVVDRTGLTGLYDIKLRYRRDDATQGSGDEADQSSVFTALQEQLGLKLVADRGPVQTLVIDGAQPPEAN